MQFFYRTVSGNKNDVFEFNFGGKMNNALKKRCQKCGKEKPLSDFYHNQTKGDMHNGICKSCQREVDQLNRAKKRIISL